MRAVLLHSTIFLISSARFTDGGLNTHGRMRIACFITCSGVCTKIAAIVPTTTIMNAAADSSALMPAPFSTAPTRIAQVAQDQADEAQDIHGAI